MRIMIYDWDKYISWKISFTLYCYQGMINHSCFPLKAWTFQDWKCSTANAATENRKHGLWFTHLHAETLKLVLSLPECFITFLQLCELKDCSITSQRISQHSSSVWQYTVSIYFQHIFSLNFSKGFWKSGILLSKTLSQVKNHVVSVTFFYTFIHFRVLFHILITSFKIQCTNHHLAHQTTTG